MNISNKGLDLLKKLEGFRSKPYHCSAGKKTIGYGHVILPNEDLKEVTLDQANTLLKHDVSWAERAVTRIFPHLPQHQFDALAIFVFNIGETQFVKSKVCSYLKLKMPDQAIYVWKQYCKALNPKTKELEPVQGLINRRNAEIDMFMGK